MTIVGKFLARQRGLIVAFFIILAVTAVYGQVRDHEFINFDDGLYVTDNEHVRQGLTLEGIRWALSFTETVTYWQPLTFIAHMLDVDLFGLDAGAHHLVNLLWHLLNALLLYFLLRNMTGCVWRSGVVAFLFAVHPIGVESVAWVAERKNVLSTFFWLLAMHAYCGYARRPSLQRYAVVFILFSMGMTAKPMLASFPFVLLLMDVWPLRRVRLFPDFETHADPEKDETRGRRMPPVRLRAALAEKVPLLIVSLGLIYAGFFIDRFKDMLLPVAHHPFPLRVANALVAYVRYPGKLIWPFDLTFFYPFPEAVPWRQVAGAVFVLTCATWLAFWKIKTRPALAVGWLWFLGTLFPTIGLLQGGLFPALADRWAYVPMIGIYVMIAWAIPDAMISRIGYRRLSGVCVLLILVCMSAGWLQVKVWSDNIALGEHTLAVSPENYVNANNMGLARFSQGRYDEAESLYLQCLKQNPRFIPAHINLGNLLEYKGNDDEAKRHYLEALRIRPEHADAHFNLANLYHKNGKTPQAIHHYRMALKLNPEDAASLTNLGNLFSDEGRLDEAVRLYLAALKIKPDAAVIHNNLGTVLLSQGQTRGAMEHFRQAVELDPLYLSAHRNLLIALVEEGRIEEARAHYQATTRRFPAFAAMPGISDIVPAPRSE